MGSVDNKIEVLILPKDHSRDEIIFEECADQAGDALWIPFGRFALKIRLSQSTKKELIVFEFANLDGWFGRCLPTLADNLEILSDNERVQIYMSHAAYAPWVDIDGYTRPRVESLLPA
ncbi:hypothetical protein XH97_15565 [Bradyrhizobium sp. CCBAU 53380]|nr:hypothetical protein [Bradyrhizobium sp. CCBAU 53380]